MLKVPSIEESIGIRVYATKTMGLGGSIKRSPEDFIVEEILADGSRASVRLEDNRVNSLAEHGRYLICVLVKRGYDTLLAIEEISRALGISSDRVGFAGIKDADALTAQYISIGGVPASKINQINIKGLAIKPLGFSNEGISPKNLFGNRFTITVRGIRFRREDAQIRAEKITHELENFGGMPNFFGHQRFGTIRPITHLVGKYIIKGDFREAALTFLTYVGPFESPRSKEVRRKLYETMDFKMALKRFPKKLIYEKIVLEHLSKSPGDYIGAFHKLPLNLRKLFVQSYQSYLFNRFLSERIRRGIPLRETIVGDYAVKLNTLGLPTRKFVRVKDSNISFINEEIMNGRMALALPLPGPKQQPSEGLQGEIEREILEEEGVSQEDFERARVIKVSVLGGLRVALTRVIDLEFDIIDDEKMLGRRAAIFRFILPKGSYATILLREYMKPSTDKELIEGGY